MTLEGIVGTKEISVAIVLGVIAETGLYLYLRRSIRWAELIVSIPIHFANSFIFTLMLPLYFYLHRFFFQYRIISWDSEVWYWVALFFLTEFFYYLHHRAGHRIGWFWLHHSVHHTPSQITICNSLRQANGLSGNWIFFLPLALLGFKFLHVSVVVLGIKTYQVFIHSELIGSLGWIDRVFQTPSNHRVHHAKSMNFQKKNFGGVLTLFDHLFGTFEEGSANSYSYGLSSAEYPAGDWRNAFSEYSLWFRRK